MALPVTVVACASASAVSRMPSAAFARCADSAAPLFSATVIAILDAVSAACWSAAAFSLRVLCSSAAKPCAFNVSSCRFAL